MRRPARARGIACHIRRRLVKVWRHPDQGNRVKEGVTKR
jgi:hypothetical protein